MNLNAEHLPNERLHLSHSDLELLLNEDETSDQSAADHMDACEVCQSRLTALAAGESWWSDAQTFLSEVAEPRWEPDTSQSSIFTPDTHRDGQLVHDTVRELLGTPNHPELMGRLGRYDIERVIGHGGMGIVLKAHDSELNRPIAIKLLSGHLSHVGAARERFAREGRAAAAVVHEHVVAIYNVESDGKVPFLVMQYVPGRSLQTRVDEDGPLGPEEILRIGMQAAAGLAAAHRQGLVHRDVKPSNILLEDTVERAVLTDFGLARTLDDASLTHTGILAGTPHYMSPEQSTGGPIDPRSDLFSLGAVLYFMATGRPPFRGPNAMAVLNRICHDEHRPVWQRNKNIPDEISDVIDQLLEKKPSNRFATADEVHQHLASLLSRLQQHGLGRRRFRAWRGKRLWRTAGWAAATILAVAAIVAGADWLNSTPQQAPSDDAAIARMIEKDLAKGFEAMRNEIPAAEFGSYFLHQETDAWNQELQSVWRDVLQLESADNPIP
jgi:hypothetical protein